MSNGILFIGGPFDGQRHDVPQDQIRDMRIRIPKRDVTLLASSPISLNPDDMDVYRMTCFSVEQNPKFVLIHESVHPNDATEMLLNNYRPALTVAQ